MSQGGTTIPGPVTFSSPITCNNLLNLQNNRTIVSESTGWTCLRPTNNLSGFGSLKVDSLHVNGIVEGLLNTSGINNSGNITSNGSITAGSITTTGITTTGITSTNATITNMTSTNAIITNMTSVFLLEKWMPVSANTTYQFTCTTDNSFVTAPKKYKFILQQVQHLFQYMT